MIPAQRENYIIEKLSETGTIKVEDLASELGVSLMTIRRDLDRLQDKGVLYRSHGGAVLRSVYPIEHTDEEKEEEINRVANEIIKNQHNSNILCIEIDSIYPNERVDLNVIAKEQDTTIEDLSVKINDAIAEMSYRVLKKAPCIEGIFSSGGDISVAICKRFKSVGLEIIGEVIPLAAYGQFIGGEFSNLKIVSKGGMVGDENGMEVCIKYLIESINKKSLIK